MSETATRLDERTKGLLPAAQFYSVDTGGANAYVMTLSEVPTAYETGRMYSFKAANANTGASTVNINGLGVKTIKKNTSSDLVSGDIIVGQLIIAQYDGTNMQLVSTYPGASISTSALSWKLMEVITFTNTSSIQTSADFANASTAKQYMILVDIQASTANQYVGMRTNGSTSTSGNNYVAGQCSYNGSIGGDAFNLGYWRLFYSGTGGANNRCTGQILVGAQEGFTDIVPVSADLAQQNLVAAVVGTKGWTHLDITYNYIKNIGFLSDQNMTGSFEIYQRV